MSDYFRFYDDSLDEPRLQYAINKMPQVISVWVWMLCQCAKKKRDTVDPICPATLLGASHKLGISPGVFNECLNVLVEINYIERSNDTYQIRKWNELQSEYMRLKKARSRSDTYMIRTKHKKLVHDTSRGEERRGEESREEKKDESKKATDKPSRDTWLTPFGDAWFKAYGGVMAYAKASKPLRSVIKIYGADRALSGWIAYCAGTEVKFASAANFSEKAGKWCNTSVVQQVFDADENLRKALS